MTNQPSRADFCRCSGREKAVCILISRSIDLDAAKTHNFAPPQMVIISGEYGKGNRLALKSAMCYMDFELSGPKRSHGNKI